MDHFPYFFLLDEHFQYLRLTTLNQLVLGSGWDERLVNKICKNAQGHYSKTRSPLLSSVGIAFDGLPSGTTTFFFKLSFFFLLNSASFFSAATRLGFLFLIGVLVTSFNGVLVSSRCTFLSWQFFFILKCFAEINASLIGAKDLPYL